jgi:hypothetical protein
MGYQETIYEVQTDEANTIFQLIILIISNSTSENKCGENNTKPYQVFVIYQTFLFINV